VSVKRIQPFESLAATARFQAVVTIDHPSAFAALSRLLSDHRGARGEVRVKTGDLTILLGRDFLLDGELAGHIETLPGVTGIELKNSETRLALVG